MGLLRKQRHPQSQKRLAWDYPYSWSFHRSPRSVESLGGWPGLPCFTFPFRTVGAPLLRSLQGRERCCLYPEVWDAQRPASQLGRSSPALYHFLVLPAIASSGPGTQPRYLPDDSGTDSPALSLRRRGLCGDAEQIDLRLTEAEAGTPSTVMQVLKQRT
jgi:hypothetical protein